MKSVVAVGYIKETRAIEGLINCLQDDYKDVQDSAVISLGKLGLPAVKPLIKLLNSDDQELAVRVSESLIKVGKPAVPYIIKFSKSQISDNTLKSSINILGKIKDTQALELLIPLLQNDSWEIIAETTIALGSIGDKRAIPHLVKLLNDEHWQVRNNALLAIGEIGDKTAINSVIPSLNDESIVVRVSAVASIGYLLGTRDGGQRTREDSLIIQRLIEMLEDIDEHPAIKAEICNTLGKTGDKRAIEPLWNIYKGNLQKVSLNAMNALGQIKDEKSAKYLIEIMGGGYSAFLDVSNLIVNIGEPAVPLLIKSLNSNNDYIRSGSAYLLGKMKVKSAIKPLFEKLNDKNYDVREKSALALGEIGKADSLTEIASFEDTTLIPKLISMLKSKNPETRMIVCKALGSIKDKRTIEPLISALNDENDDVRWESAFALGEIGEFRIKNLELRIKNISMANDLMTNDLIVKALLNHTEDPNWQVRSRCFESLGKMGTVEAIPHLISALKDNFALRETPSNALIKIGKPAVKELINEYWRAKADYRGLICQILGEIKDTSAVSTLISALDDEDKSVRISAGFALAKIGDKKAIPLIIKLFSINYKATLEILIYIGEPAVKPLIASLINEKNKTIREGCVKTLGELGDRRAIIPLMKSLDDNDKDIRKLSATALGKLKAKESVNLLIKKLDDTEPEVRHYSAEALGNIKDKKAVEPLIKKLESTDNTMRYFATKALGNIGDKKALPHIIKRLDDSESVIREISFEILGKMGDTLAIPYIIKALQNEKNYNVKYKAYNALSNFPDTRVVDVMISALNEENMVIRGFASTTLMHLGKLAVPSLIEALKNENPEIKWNACIILGEIGNKSAIEPLTQLLNNASAESDTTTINPIIREALRKIHKRNYRY